MSDEESREVPSSSSKPSQRGKHKRAHDRALKVAAQGAVRRNKKGKQRAHGGPMPDETRIEAVIRMLDELEDPRRICRVIARDFKVDERTVRNDLARARAEIASQPKLSTPDLRELRLRVAIQRFKSCVRKGDEKNANAWFDKVLRVEGAYAPDALKMMTMEFADLQGLDDAGLERVIEEERLLFFSSHGPGVPARAESKPSIGGAVSRNPGLTPAIEPSVGTISATSVPLESMSAEELDREIEAVRDPDADPDTAE